MAWCGKAIICRRRTCQTHVSNARVKRRVVWTGLYRVSELSVPQVGNLQLNRDELLRLVDIDDEGPDFGRVADFVGRREDERRQDGVVGVRHQHTAVFAVPERRFRVLRVKQIVMSIDSFSKMTKLFKEMFKNWEFLSSFRQLTKINVE